MDYHDSRVECGHLVLSHFDIYISACNCDQHGSSEPVCDVITGQCKCHTNVAVAGENNTRGEPADLRCSSCLQVSTQSGGLRVHLVDMYHVL